MARVSGMVPFDLRAFRIAMGWKQYVASKELFVCQSAVSRWETEARVPRIFREYILLKWPDKSPRHIHIASRKSKRKREAKQTGT